VATGVKVLKEAIEEPIKWIAFTPVLRDRWWWTM